MPADRRAVIEAIFEEALDLTEDRRGAWLADRCAADAELHREVQLLLAAHERESALLDRPAPRQLTDLLREPARGRRIGPYTAVRELGRGGMGVVYLAERDDGHYRRRVAVKVLRASPDGDELHRRFLAERQILASLSHPNIAQLLDGGVSDGELPYLVMEYVDGLPITDYCDRHRLGVRQRLLLFQDVCAAVHHAHKNLVLHRDLKPGNVLVTAAGEVKLLDFGIAKLLNPSLAGTAQAVTRTVFRVMTPAYASPEQLRGDTLTTASDVYALGLLLYELLAGRSAHGIAEDSARAVFEAVCEREPDRPSDVVAGAAATATARDTTPDRLSRQLRGDLDAIVAMALRKVAGRRYGSAELLAEDIGRHLDGLPVVAHRGSRSYRLEKLVRRHRAAAAFAAVSAFLLLSGAGVALVLASVAARARDRAAAALVQTRHALRESEEVSAFLVSLFEASNAAEGRPDTLSAADLLRRGVARAEQLGSEPLAQARMLEALGTVYASREELPLGAELLRRALTLRRTYAGVNHPVTATTAAELAEVLRRQGHYPAADTLALEALRARRLTLGGAHPDVAASLGQLSSLSVYLSDLPAAERYQREAVAVRRLGGPGEDSALVRDLERLGSVLRRRSDDVGAERALREALTLAQRTFAGPQRDRVFVMLRLADLLDQREATRGEAESLYRSALAECRAAFGDGHTETAQVMKQVGLMHVRHGRAEEGERLVRQSLALQRRTLGPSHTEVAGTMVALAQVLRRDGYSAEAEQLTRDALAIYASALGTGHSAYAGTLGYLAGVMAQRGALDSAEILLRRALAIRTASFGERGGITALTATGLADVLAQQGRFAAAESTYRGALAVLRSHAPDTHLDVRRTYALLASLYQAWGKRDSAAVYRSLAGPVDLRQELWP